jgi:TRAP-type mannitol/chloroaromatic compound transport system substrate-binding protein
MLSAHGWMHQGVGIAMCSELFQTELNLNVEWIPILPSCPQAFGWFKRPIKTLADFKGMKCRQTGMAAEVWKSMGMNTVNMPGGEIIPAAQRGVIDCAEWVGGVEDLRLGFQNVWKYHYTPGVHENVTIGEVLINGDVWKGLKPEHQELIKSVASETFIIWWAKWQRQNADAIRELQVKHGVQILRTPPDILVEFLKAWDKIAKEEADKNAFFKKTHDSQREYAALVVPAKRFMFPPYSFVANYYWPEKAAGKGKK